MKNNQMKGKTFKLFIYIIFISIIFHEDSISQINVKKVIPGPQYKSGFIHEMFLGKHWRDLWNTQITVDVLDPDTYAGGLTPLKKGGGLQTKSLRLKGNDGNEYKFRSLNKDPTRSLPPELQQSVYADILKDQISIGLPVSALIVYPLMKKTGMLCVKPELVILSDKEKLGIFRKDFGGVLGIMELNPRAGKKGYNDFENADKVVNGFEIFDKTEKDNDEQINQKEFLKARLMDIFLGDRDRHADQWQWAGYKNNGKRIWLPIPRDRDYAFCRYDGFFPWLSGLLAHSLVGFNKDYPSMLELTWSGRHLDRRFLNGLSKTQWDSVAAEFQKNLSDSLITHAVRQMPPEMFAKEGRNLISMLKHRRNNLREASEEFYEVYSDVVDVYGSDKGEFAEIKVIDKNKIELNLFEKDKNTGNKKTFPFFTNVFDNKYTNEIRLYMLGGNDGISLRGKKDNGMLLRIISGEGKDELKNNSSLKIKLYDSDHSTVINSKEDIYYNDEKYKVTDDQHLKYEPRIEDRYGFWAFTPIINYNNDDGWILGGGPNYIQYGFRAHPHLYYTQLTGAYATTAKDYDVRFYSDFTKIIGKARTRLFIKASQLDFNRYYGSGNETNRTDSLADRNFYKTNQQDIIVEPEFEFPVAQFIKFKTGLTYRYSNIIDQDSNINLLSKEQPYGSDKISGISMKAGIIYENKDNGIIPNRGFYADINGRFYPAMLDYEKNFFKMNSSINFFHTLKALTDINLILKCRGEIIFGEYPFFEAAVLGGQLSLRGFPRDRYLGDAMLSGQSELRIKIAELNLLMPGKLGISAIGDIGRVFLKGEESKKWHSAYGGGLWLNVINAVDINFITAVSTEVTRFYFNFNFNYN